MSDGKETPPEADEVDEGAGAEQPTGPLAGERLAEARREKQITVTEIAKELHLDEAKVRAIERNEFDVLGAPVFAKGHLRKYADIVGASIDDVLADYYQLDRTVSAPPVVTGQPRLEREFSPGPWIIAGLIVAFALIAWWYFGLREPAPDAPQRSEPVTQPATVPDDPDAGGPAPQQPSDAGPDSGVDELPGGEGSAASAIAMDGMPDAAAEELDNTAALAPAESAPAAAAAPPADGEVRLEVRFSGDCWTEISDANGERLFFNLGRSGRTVTVSGAAPLSVLFGNADNVDLRVNGAAYEIPAASRRGDTARLSLASP